jgi:hypothetical protein
MQQMHVTCAAKEKALEMPFPEKESVLDAVSSTEALKDVVDELLLDGVLKTVDIGATPTYGLAMPVSVIRHPTLALVTLTCEVPLRPQVRTRRCQLTAR